MTQYASARSNRLATRMVVELLDPFRTTGAVRTGRAEDVIARYAEEVHADLIVMGIHGDHLPPQPAIGRVVGNILGRVGCPVLTIPDDGMMAGAVDVGVVSRTERVAF